MSPSSFRQGLLDLLSVEPTDESRVLAAIDACSRRREPVYSALLELLAHLSFSESEARRHWRLVVAHRRALQRALKRDPGLRVALLDYFANLNHELRNPKVIEMSIYESTERSARTDGLTGLSNQAFLLQGLRREVQRAQRHGGGLALVMLDLDDFKRVNDARGHVEGDRLLAAVAAIVRDNLREIDTAARYGGEEFALLLPETTRRGAFVVAERIRAAVERTFARRRGALRATLSGGVAAWPDDAREADELLRRADEALYRAKAAGKNRIVLARGERRRHDRLKPRGAAVLGPGGARPTRLRNVSAGGLLVALPQAPALGSEVDVVVQPRKGPGVGLRGTVVRVAQAGRTFDVGLRLDDTSAAAELVGQLAPASRAPAGRQVVAARRRA